ncbi:hypothetical protein PtA15_11A435 [Puccinia triticina]|uniref:Uncharacterized protein n=1 Tax=Puccinia triticina TaxID=208348 RepID=A0ABY7CWR4_9BASI|nr:uncharacterized protein PtA15_11A435 [Puccinia triticina]WAQ89744.1 hypothetical protein PtA15_11A435 [Puccinia triticina]
MVAFKFAATLFLAISLAAAHPINEQLVGRQLPSQVVTTTSSYQKLTSEISQLQESISSGGISRSEARQKMEAIYSSATQTLSTAGSCGSCWGSGAVNTVSSSASQTYQAFSRLAQTVNQVYGDAAPDVFSPVARLDPLINQNLNKFSQSGAAINSFLPQGGQAFGRLGLWQTANFANQFSSNSQSGTNFRTGF